MTLTALRVTAQIAVLIGAIAALPAQAQEATLRIHHFMSAKAPMHQNILIPFAQRLEDASDGRLKVELYDSMSLGGRPGDLYDQAVDGAVDAVLTLPGYTAGRFNQTEVFELPFMSSQDTVATSKAFWNLVESDLQAGEYEDVKILAAWVHGPGVVHSVDPINSLDDIKGKDMRGPTRLATDYLAEIGANPVGMPLPAIPENLSKGVIKGTLLPWEITSSIKLSELVGHHAEIGGDKALYVATFILAMNWDAFESLPEDLQKIIDEHSGEALSAVAAELTLDADVGSRAVSEAAGNSIVRLDGEEAARWQAAAEPVYDRFVERSADEGFDGAALIEKARGLIEVYQ